MKGVYGPKVYRRGNINFLASIEYSLEWVSLSRFLHGTENVLVDPEADSDCETCECEVGHHTEHGEHCKGQQHQHHAAEHHTTLLHIPPVYQVQYYKYK